MGKGKRFLKKLLKDRREHVCRLYCDKLQINDKLNELGGKETEDKLRKNLAELTKKQRDGEGKREKEEDKKLADEIKELNDSINLIAGLYDGIEKTNLQVIEFERYIKVVKNALDNPDSIKTMNKILY